MQKNYLRIPNSYPNNVKKVFGNRKKKFMFVGHIARMRPILGSCVTCDRPSGTLK